MAYCGGLVFAGFALGEHVFHKNKQPSKSYKLRLLMVRVFVYYSSCHSRHLSYGDISKFAQVNCVKNARAHLLRAAGLNGGKCVHVRACWVVEGCFHPSGVSG